MKFIGVVAAKSQSLRFPGKNKYKYKGQPLFWHSVDPLIGSRQLQDIIVATDCAIISDYSKQNGVKVQKREINAIENEAPLLEVLKQVSLNYPHPFDYLVTIMANCPGHTSKDVNVAINKILKYPELNEIRSFDNEGNETGLMVFSKKTIMRSAAISSHIGAIVTNGFEVHYESDLS